MKQTVIWSVLEYVCRLLGVSTGAVLLGVGIDTLLHGQSKSLALYLLDGGFSLGSGLLCQPPPDLLLRVSFLPVLPLTGKWSPVRSRASRGSPCKGTFPRANCRVDQYSAFEAVHLSGLPALKMYNRTAWRSAPLPLCSPWRGSAMHTCWLRAKRRGAFQKFLAYALLSIACFLSPVHVWQVMLPGTQLILTSLAYFLLSKQQKEDTGNGPPEQSSDPHDEAVDEMAEDRSRETSSFHRKFGSLAGRLRSFFQACQRPKAFMASSCLVSRKKPVGLEEQVEEMVLPLGEEPEGLAKESTSETAFILSPQM
ncbi:transmembrane protein 72 isoform X2 [Crotalus tigris]|uniref:transmembrane protein 72 isoform X2 n=1 Tax=Crotalus tigris TaxID=88082 RepID=UPI00192F2368|nr:transmembrane protein 72 isoform X2 [Crotalus tigris]